MNFRRWFAQIAAKSGGSQPIEPDFDSRWYAARYPDVMRSRQDPARHFHDHGRSEGRFRSAAHEAAFKAGANLDADWYLNRYPDVLAGGWSALEHYAQFGQREGRATSQADEEQRVLEGRFHSNWYRLRYPEIEATGLSPLDHFIRIGRDRGWAATPEEDNREAWRDRFDPDWYRGRYEDVRIGQHDPLEHFITIGLLERRFPNGAEEAQRITAHFQPDWYRLRYPEMRDSGLNPLEHYMQVGRHRGWAASPAEDDRDAWCGRFDEEWYLGRNPDVRESGIDPLEHFIKYGLIEGRSPNSAEEPRHAWNSRFNAEWYKARYPEIAISELDPLEHFLQIGIRRGWAPSYTEEDREAWRGRFDADWYLERNQDVREAGHNPLEHFLSHGLLERRRPNSRETLPAKDVEDARIEIVKPFTGGNEVALFVTHVIGKRLKPHVDHYVRALARRGISVVIIAATDQVLDLDAAFVDAASGIYVRENQGFDFAAWAHVVRLCPGILDGSILYLVNDSVFGPTSDESFDQLLTQIRSSPSDMIGLTENLERNWHLQSYFLAFRDRALRSDALRDFFTSIVSFETKNDVVNEYETQLSRVLSAAGLRCEALYPTPGVPNPTLFRWRQLLAAGFPFVKVATVRDVHKNVDKSGWREALSCRGYDTAMADLSLADLATHSLLPAVKTPADAKFNFRRSSLAELHRFFASGRIIKLPTSQRPDVSILMVVYNEAELTLQCLLSLENHFDGEAEVVIVDNASTDDTPQLLHQVRGARILRNVEDLHFLRAANQAAARASGRAILLINNDAVLRPHAIRYGLNSLDSADDVGAVGGKLILPDGSLQEAGSIIWADAACLGYGRGRDPDTPEYQFRREVDYCSGAYMILRRDVFEALGRFDTVYAPAYYEETDLCMRMRKAGYRILYDPRVEVSHYEFASTAHPGEASQLMQRNLKIFHDRHASALRRIHIPSTGSILLARMTDRWRPRLLMIDDLVPNPSYGAGFPRTHQILTALNELGFFVTYYPVHHAVVDKSEIFTYLPVDVEFVLGADRPSLDDLISSRAGYYNAIIVCRPDNMRQLSQLFMTRPDAFTNLKIIYDSEAVTSPRDAMKRRLNGQPQTRGNEKAALDEEVGRAAITDAVITVNEYEANFFRERKSVNVHVLSHSVDARPTQALFSERRDFLFVGAMGHDTLPNVDSLFWFIEEVMPRLNRSIGSDYRLLVAGPTGSEKLQQLHADRVKVLGRVPDLTDIYDRARVFIAPTRFAAGIPLKVLEAASRGVPCVATDLLARQLGWNVGGDILVATSADDFARQCASLYTDQVLWNTIRQRSLNRISKSYNPRDFEAKLVDALDSVKIHPPARRRFSQEKRAVTTGRGEI